MNVVRISNHTKESIFQNVVYSFFSVYGVETDSEITHCTWFKYSFVRKSDELSRITSTKKVKLPLVKYSLKTYLPYAGRSVANLASNDLGLFFLQTNLLAITWPAAEPWSQSGEISGCRPSNFQQLVVILGKCSHILANNCGCYQIVYNCNSMFSFKGGHSEICIVASRQ